MPVAIYIGICIICGIISSEAAKNKGRHPWGWFAIGLLLGPLGLIWSLVTYKDQETINKKQLALGMMRECDHCASILELGTKKCRFCGEDAYEQPKAITAGQR